MRKRDTRRKKCAERERERERDAPVPRKASFIQSIYFFQLASQIHEFISTIVGFVMVNVSLSEAPEEAEYGIVPFNRRSNNSGTSNSQSGFRLRSSYVRGSNERGGPVGC